MKKVLSHPSFRAMRAVAGDSCIEGLTEEVELHAQSCPDCQASLEELRASDTVTKGQSVWLEDLRETVRRLEAGED